jgi:hypothetical protein
VDDDARVAGSADARAKLTIVTFAANIARAIELAFYPIAFYLLVRYLDAGTLDEFDRLPPGGD